MSFDFVVKERHLESVDGDFLYEAVDVDDEIFVLTVENAERTIVRGL